MTEQDTGTLVLKAVPAGPVEQEVKAFLAKVFKNLSPEKLSGLVGRTPVVLSKNVPASTGAKIAENLIRLGASVDFVSRSGQRTAPQAGLSHEGAEQVLPSENSNHATAEPTALKAPWLSEIGSRLAGSLAEVNKELWLVLSLLLLAAFMNYMVTGQRMVLGFYTLPTLFSAYFYGRRHATLTAFASVFLVGLLVRFNPQLLSEPSVGTFVDARWYDLTAWAGILVVTAYAMGTLHEHHEARVQELRQTYHGLLMILRQFVSKDKYTENHSYRVSVYASKIASCLGLPRQTIEDIRDASLLHDIGKLDVSRELLYKAARLTEEEFRNMKQHVEKGVGLLEPAGGPLRRIIPIILAHHDKFDGTGYHGISGDRIPLEARVVAVADVYDSLTSDRPYRKAMSAFDAKQIIVKGAGTDFDPRVVNAFVKAFVRGEMEVPEVMV